MGKPEKSVNLVKKDIEEILSSIDKMIERWTWDRFQRIEQSLLPKITKEIDKKIEKWTWDRYLRIEGQIWNLLFEINPEKMKMSLGDSSVYDLDFYLRNRYGSVRSAQSILQALFQWLPHKTVVDFGCGTGTWLWVASAFGAQEILGLDGAWVPKSMLMIPEDDFRPTDLQKLVVLEKRFELAMSLEVAEHLRPDAADTFVTSLCHASDIVLFSAAHPGQGGDNHINEQPMKYWVEKFESHGFHKIHILDYIPEARGKIERWYQDNLILFVHSRKHEEMMRRLSKVDGAIEGRNMMEENKKIGKNNMDEILSSVDKIIEKWTWDRYLKIKNELLPIIDKSVERWTWDRYIRIKSEYAQQNQVLQDMKEDIAEIQKRLLVGDSQSIGTFDVVIPLGPACRPAYQLSEHHLRFSAFPLDWQMDYSMEAVTHLFETDFIDFFQEVREDMEREAQLNSNPDHANKRFVIDIKNNITSIHHFFKNVSLDEGKVNFHKIMSKRAKHLVSILETSRNIAFLCNRTESIFQFQDFLEVMHGKFPQIYFTFINMRHTEKIERGTMNLKCYDGEYFKILDYSFNDKNEIGGSKEDWKGNMESWHSVLKHVHLNDDKVKNSFLHAFDDE